MGNKHESLSLLIKDQFLNFAQIVKFYKLLKFGDILLTILELVFSKVNAYNLLNRFIEKIGLIILII